MNQILVPLQLEAEEQEFWERRATDLGQHIHEHLWDPEHQRLIPHVYPGGISFVPGGFDESSVFLPHTAALILGTDLLSDPDKNALRQQIRNHLAREDLSTFGLATTPPYPIDDLASYHLKGWERIEGSDHTPTCAHTGLHLIQSGHSDVGIEVLKRIAYKACEDSRFYAWYTPDHCPQHSDLCRSAASVFLKGANDLKLKKTGANTFKPSLQDKPSPEKHRYELGYKQLNLTLKRKRMEEKRSNRRLPLTIPTSIYCAETFKRQWLSGVTRFPSMSGLCLETGKEIPEGSILIMKIQTKQRDYSQNCKLRGRVVWTHHNVLENHYKCGVQLITGYRFSRRKWRRFIMKHLRKIDAK